MPLEVYRGVDANREYVIIRTQIWFKINFLKPAYGNVLKCKSEVISQKLEEEAESEGEINLCVKMK